MTEDQRAEYAARAQGWITSDLTPHSLVNPRMIGPDGQAEFFTCPPEFSLWINVCILHNIEF